MADNSQLSASAVPELVDVDALPVNLNTDEDQDTCRICSAPAENDAPLFHPCKCSGTIRYIHQDCLTTWLAHSKKKTCDVCKYPYAFTKVYAQNMPGRLPVLLLVRRSLQQLFFIGLTSLRGILVGCVWLAILPWITVWTWRMYFAMGNSTAWWISARALDDTMNTTFLSNLTVRVSRVEALPVLSAATNATQAAAAPTTPLFESLFRSLLSPLVHPNLLRSISSDVFTGQIIATAIVLVFIAVFLLREWISQNARPGVFDDAAGAPAAGEAEHAHRAELEAHEIEQERERAREHMRQHDIERRQKALQRVQQKRNAAASAANSQASGPASSSSTSAIAIVGPDGAPRQMRKLPQRARPLLPTNELGLPPRLPTSMGTEMRSHTRPSLASSGNTSSSDHAASSVDEYRTEPWSSLPESVVEKGKMVSYPQSTSNEGRFTFAKADGAAFRFAPPATPNTTLPYALTSSLSTNTPSSSALAETDALYPTRHVSASSSPLVPETVSPSGSVNSTQSAVSTTPAPPVSAAYAPTAPSSFSTSSAYFKPSFESAFVPSTPATTLPYPLTPSSATLPPMRRPSIPASTQASTSGSGLTAFEPGTSFHRNATRRSTIHEPVSSTLDCTRPISELRQRNEMPDNHSEVRVSHEAAANMAAEAGVPVDIRGDYSMATGTSASPSADAESEGAGPNTSPRPNLQIARNLSEYHLFDPPDFRRRAPSDVPSDITPPDSASEDSAWPNPSDISKYNSATWDEFFLPRPPSPDRSAGSSSIARPTSVPMPPLRRPPMVSSTPPALVSDRASGSRSGTPLSSPSLATYQPPEALQDRGYFGKVVVRENTESKREVEEETRRYFRRAINGDNTQDGDSSDSEDDDDLESLERLEPEGVLITVREVSSEQMRMELEMQAGQNRDVPNAQAIAGERPVDPQVEVEEDADADAEEDAEIDVDMDRDALAEEAGLEPLADDGDGVAEDDMEGALEAIGMRGPLFVLVQNAALMTFVLDTVIGLGVWLPFTLGKTAALLSLDPMRALYLLHLPIRAIRFVTDPIVDSVIFFLNRVLLPVFWRAAVVCSAAFSWTISHAIQYIAGERYVHKLSTESKTWELIQTAPRDFYRAMRSYAVNIISSSPSKPARSPSISPGLIFTILKQYLGAEHVIVKKLEALAAEWAGSWRAAAAQRSDILMRLALGDGVNERVFAVSLGYAIIAFALLMYLYLLNIGTVKSAGRAVKSAVRQQLLIVKVVVFILIELFIFPLSCGINLDFCSTWMFPETTLDTRIAFFKQAPITSVFYHWIVGTMFMYQLAILLAGSRTIMRPGAMWFIRDASDSNFHPIRDILERPALLQLRKLLFSALMYCLVLTSGVGCVGGLMRLLSPNLLPLRWRPREPLSAVPIDLLFVHILLPYTMRYFRPKKYIRRAATRTWRFLACRLRLTSYMFGEDAPDEKYTPKEWRLWTEPRPVPKDQRPPFDGSYRRVPASDTVVVPRSARATAEVNIHGQAVNDEALRLIASQNVEAQLAKRNPQHDYTVVYVPSHFRWRIAAFLLALWTIGCVCAVVTLSAPILAGRQVFKLFVKKEVHDGYSFFVGFYLLWGSFLSGYLLEALYDKRAHYFVGMSRMSTYTYALKTLVVLLSKVTYMTMALGVVVPILMALVVEMYFVLPFRIAINPRAVPHIRIVDMWALGLIYAKIALRSTDARRHQGPIARGIRTLQESSWLQLDPWSATKDVIGPLVLGLVAMLVVPPLMAHGVIRLLRLEVDPLWSYHQVYPALFSFVSICRSSISLGRHIASWTHSIRDKEYLVELKLRNFEDAKAEKEKRAQLVKQKPQ